MPYRSMTVEEFARHVGMDPRDAYKMADRGKLPAQKVGGKWRFNRAQVTEWLQQEMHLMDEGRLIAIEKAMGLVEGEEFVTEESKFIVTNLIGLDGIDVALHANTRASVLRELIRLADRTGLLWDGPGLLEALEAREEMCSTALPNGIAIPHPRQPLPYAAAEPMICVARLTRGIAFGSSYGTLPNLFILVCCQDDRHHLSVLARLMRMLDDETLDKIHAAETKEELLQVLIDKERQVIADT